MYFIAVLENVTFWSISVIIVLFFYRYLCLKKKNTANDAFESYTTQHPNIKGPPFLLPLLNFICFLLKIIERLVF